MQIEAVFLMCQVHLWSWMFLHAVLAKHWVACNGISLEQNCCVLGWMLGKILP